MKVKVIGNTEMLNDLWDSKIILFKAELALILANLRNLIQDGFFLYWNKLITHQVPQNFRSPRELIFAGPPQFCEVQMQVISMLLSIRVVNKTAGGSGGIVWAL